MNLDATNPLNVLISRVLTKINERCESREKCSGLSSGFRDFDAMTQGFQPGSLTIVAARPSMGKTAFALNVVNNVLENKIPVLIVSNEDSKERVIERLLTIASKIDAWRLSTGHLYESDWSKLGAASERLTAAPLAVDDRALTVRQIYNRCKSIIDSGVNLQLVVIDYIQLIAHDEETSADDENNLSSARRLKRIAAELNISIIALSQIARAVEYRKNRRPLLSDLRGNAVDGDGADLVVFIYRDEYYNPETEYRGEAEIIIAKQRYGPVGIVELLFQASDGTYRNKFDRPLQIDSDDREDNDVSDEENRILSPTDGC